MILTFLLFECILVFFSYSSFRFMAKLRGRCGDFLCISSLTIFIASSIIDIPDQSRIFVIIGKPILIFLNHPKSIVYLKVCS